MRGFFLLLRLVCVASEPDETTPRRSQFPDQTPVAEHLGYADPGFTARIYAHVMRDASRGGASRSVKRSERHERPPP